MRGGRRNFKDRDQINKITAGSPECFSAMRCIIDRRLLIAPPERYPSPPKRFWWGRRGFAPPVLEVEAVRIFDWLSPDHEFPVGRMDSRNVRILERALRGLSHVGDTRSLRYQRGIPSPRTLHHRRAQVDSGLHPHRAFLTRRVPR